MDIRQRLEALAAMPKEWRCTWTFSNGKVRTLDQPTAAMAEAHANGKRRFIGKPAKHEDGSPVLDNDGKPVTLVSVTVHRVASN